jgi:hypothetical protein
MKQERSERDCEEVSAEDASEAINGGSPLASFLACLVGFLTGTLGLCSELLAQK